MAKWMCQSGHVNQDPDTTDPYCTVGACLSMLAYEIEEEDPPGPYVGNVDDVDCDPENPPEDGAECPGPHEEPESKYKIDESKGTVKKTTTEGKIRLFPLPTANKNQTDRPKMPKFLKEKKDLETFPGAKGTGLVHPAVVTKLQEMIDAMKAEGERIDDKGLKEVYVKSPWRDPADGGPPYLAALKRYLKQHKDCHKDGKKCVAPEKWATRCSPGFEKLTFPSSMEKEAKSNLGSTSSSKFKTFKTNLGKAGGGWTAAFANYFLDSAGGWKAPAGGSNHHSGLVVDLDWPIWNGKKVVKLNTNTDINKWGRRSAAGVWINKHAASFGFKSYNEAKEIWHMEWVDWKGTTAEPK